MFTVRCCHMSVVIFMLFMAFRVYCLVPVFFLYVFVGVMLAIWVVPMITMCFSVRTMMCLSVVVCGFGSQQGYSLKKVVVLGRFFKSESLERSINWHDILHWHHIVHIGDVCYKIVFGEFDALLGIESRRACFFTELK